jgi:chorismate mutase
MKSKTFLSLTIVMISIIGKVKAQDQGHKDTLTYYRTQIDTLDKQIIDLLGKRMGAARAIGIYKMDHQMGVVQSVRFEEVLQNAIKRGKDQQLSEEFIRALYNDIHKESVNQQELLQKQRKKDE